MPRIRTVKPEFFQDEKLAPLPVLDRFVFLGLVCMADDAGRLLDNPKVIDAFVFPESADSCANALMKLAALGRIRRGRTASGQAVIQLVNWERHQRVEKPNLRGSLPAIADESPTFLQHLADESGSQPVVLDDASETDRRTIPTTNDQRPGSTTDDRGPTKPSSARGGGSPVPEDLASWIPEDYHADLEAALRSARSPIGIIAELRRWRQEPRVALAKPLTGEHVGAAIRSAGVKGHPLSANVLLIGIRIAQQDPPPLRSNEPTPDAVHAQQEAVLRGEWMPQRAG